MYEGEHRILRANSPSPKHCRPGLKHRRERSGALTCSKNHRWAPLQPNNRKFSPKIKTHQRKNMDRRGLHQSPELRNAPLRLGLKRGTLFLGGAHSTSGGQRCPESPLLKEKTQDQLSDSLQAKILRDSQRSARWGYGKGKHFRSIQVRYFWLKKVGGETDMS